MWSHRAERLKAAFGTGAIKHHEDARGALSFCFFTMRNVGHAPVANSTCLFLNIPVHQKKRKRKTRKGKKEENEKKNIHRKGDKRERETKRGKKKGENTEPPDWSSLVCMTLQ